MGAARRRQVDKYNQSLLLAWHVATLQREPKLTKTQFTKRLVQYERKVQTREQMLTVLKMIGNTVRAKARHG